MITPNNRGSTYRDALNPLLTPNIRGSTYRDALNPYKPVFFGLTRTLIVIGKYQVNSLIMIS